MRALLSLLVMTVAALGLRSVAGAGAMSTALAVGLLILGGWLAGLVCSRVRLPAVTGYLLWGGLVGPYALGLVGQGQVEHDLQFAGDLAVALIGLIAGGEIRLTALKGQGRRLGRLIGVHVVVLLAVVMGGLVAAWWCGLKGQVEWREYRVIVLLVGTASLAASPAVVVAMLSEYRAGGPLSQMSMLLSVLKDLLLVMLFTAALSLGKSMAGQSSQMGLGFVGAIASQLVGSVVVGVLLGMLMAIYARRIAAHLVIFTIGGCMFIALLGESGWTVGGQAVHLEPLLMALSAGLVMRNLWPEQTEVFFEAVESTSLPVYCLFFALAGAGFDWRAFLQWWPMAVGLSMLRLVGLWVSLRAGLAAGGYGAEQALRGVWLGMWPQAGVSLVLVMLIGQSFGGAGHEMIVQAGRILLGAIFIDQFIGPIGFGWALSRSGEVGRMARSVRVRSDQEGAAVQRG